jgi:intracellular septation protein
MLERPFLRMVLGSSFRLDDAGWRKLTLRWIGFFLFLALVNEVARRALSTQAWATFKVFGVLGLTLVFSLLQMPLIRRHELPEDAEADRT